MQYKTMSIVVIAFQVLKMSPEATSISSVNKSNMSILRRWNHWWLRAFGSSIKNMAPAINCTGCWGSTTSLLLVITGSDSQPVAQVYGGKKI